ncbi:MAG: SUMF1/EgtB/PvdO family nonheme iron enzyme [Pseudomonadota bacterium]|uniref:SUMF1/EgtB/PvdO family nonheme iron enzyme n=1 Tax=Candidatus Desulfatibia profunda TaxID=2841695 RepID=A0A8J6NVY8_9BACT|nr:SUMF1/EgtB/PvdO family nonheme iron enzyme [Candidatus Desulfatibia profunda]MBL7179155.1 SUMF1/EgtB/PvdO family nonheme iron enzyme [Desulfobacterales bacterium]
MEELIKKCLPTYEIGEKLGQGVYGSVYRIYDRFKERAVKVVPILLERSLSHSTSEQLDTRVSQDFHAVKEYYGNIKGEGILEIYDFYLVDKMVSNQNARAHLVILMELCRSNLLDHVLDNYPLAPEEACNLMRTLASILKRLSADIEHIFFLTDLKPSNLLFSSNHRLVIGDLGGLRRLSSMSASTDSQFSLNWSAPEFILQGAKAGMASAVFSYGLVSYFIWEGHLPYEDADYIERLRKIKANGVSFDRPDIPERIVNLIQKCLAYFAKDRPEDFSRILKILEGPDDNRDKTISFPEKSILKPAPDTARSGNSGTFRQHGSTVKATSADPPSGAVWEDPVLAMRFVWVPEGAFIPGLAGADEDGEPFVKSSQSIHVDGFWIGQYPVTQGQWHKIMGNNPSHFNKGANYPVENVSYHNTCDFIRRLMKKSNERFRYGLPTEAQWEYAARSAGRAEIYSGGVDLDSLGWYRKNSNFSPHSFGTKFPNGLGIYDMSGNVMEWCGDGSIPDPEEFVRRGDSIYADIGIKHAGRGGSWNSDENECRTYFRKLFTPRLGYSTLGFRIVRMP